MKAMCEDWLEQYDAWQEQVASDPRPIIQIDALTKWLRDRFDSKDVKTKRFTPMSFYGK